MKDRYLKEFNEENLDLLNGILRDMYDALGSVEADDRIVNLALGDIYTDRGDPAAWDYSIGSGLTADSAYHDLDVSSIVAVGAERVKLNIFIQDNAIGTNVAVRKKGNSNEINSEVRYIVVANTQHQFSVDVMLNAGYKFEYKIQTGMDSTYIAVMGWW